MDIVARHTGPRGEVVLRRRTEDDTEVTELIVNGAFAMDSTETTTEENLGRIALTGRRDGTPYRVLIGGLGLGYTAAAVLGQRLDGVDVVEVDVVEVEDCLVDWARRGLTPTLASVAADPRVTLHAADVRSVLLGHRDVPAGPWNAIVLDVDNGPDFLIHTDNEDLYTDITLRAAYDRLRVGGVLAIWCQGPAPDLRRALEQIGPTQQLAYEVARGQRRLGYVIYVLTRDPDLAGP